MDAAVRPIFDVMPGLIRLIGSLGVANRRFPLSLAPGNQIPGVFAGVEIELRTLQAARHLPLNTNIDEAPLLLSRLTLPR